MCVIILLLPVLRRLFAYTTLFRSYDEAADGVLEFAAVERQTAGGELPRIVGVGREEHAERRTSSIRGSSCSEENTAELQSATYLVYRLRHEITAACNETDYSQATG